MREFVFYTEEGYTESPTGKTVENLQILGFAMGTDEANARKILLKENPWIIEYGFNEKGLFCKEIIVS